MTDANRTVTVVSLVARPSHTRAEVEAEVVGLALFVHAISGTVHPVRNLRKDAIIGSGKMDSARLTLSSPNLIPS